MNLNLPLSGWDRLAWLPLSLEVELPAARLAGLFRRHWQPDLKRPGPEHFLETLRELIAWVAEREPGAGLLLQCPEQRQPDVSLRGLLLRRRQSRSDRNTRAEALFDQVSRTLPAYNRGILALHCALLAELGEQDRAEALSGELFYRIDAAHAETARDQLIADLAARRIAPEAVWQAYEQHGARWLVWQRISWLDAYGAQPDGLAVGIRSAWLYRLSLVLLDAGGFGARAGGS